MNREKIAEKPSRYSRHRGYTKSQLAALEAAFSEDNYITGQRKIELAVTTELTKKQIKMWFSDRRKKEQNNSEKVATVETPDITSQRPTFIRYSETQLETLEQAFAENTYAEGERKAQLAAATSLTKKQVANWFLNRRRKEVHGKRSREAPLSVITKAQREILEVAFAEKNFLDWEKRDALAEETGLTKAQVSQWFRSHRRSLKERSIRAGITDVADEMKVTPAQEKVLMDMFLEHSFLNMGELADMVKRTGLEEEQVKEWFKRQRELTEEETVIKEEPEDDYE